MRFFRSVEGVVENMASRCFSRLVSRSKSKFNVKLQDGMFFYYCKYISCYMLTHRLIQLFTWHFEYVPFYFGLVDL